MALNRIREEAEQVALPVPDGTVSGDALCLGSLPCVALTDKDAAVQPDGTATVQTDGSFLFEVAVATEVGDIIYWHEGSGSPATLNKTSSGGTRFGYALEAQAGAGAIEVKIGY